MLQECSKRRLVCCCATPPAEKNGLQYEIAEPNPRPDNRPKRFQGYGDNFRCAVRLLPLPFFLY